MHGLLFKATLGFGLLNLIHAYLLYAFITNIQKLPKLFCTCFWTNIYACTLVSLYSFFIYLFYIIGKGKETRWFHSWSSHRPWTWWCSAGNHHIIIMNNLLILLWTICLHLHVTAETNPSSLVGPKWAANSS
jgi:hypothetical protein